MTAYTWNHLQCNGCQAVLTTTSTKDGKKIPGTKSAMASGWRIRYDQKGMRPTTTRTRFDFCPTCLKNRVDKKVMGY